MVPERWQKEGLVFSPRGQRRWLGTHAALPVAWPLDDGRHRVYFATRDDQHRSRIGYVALRLDEPHGDQFVSERPVLEPGPLGHFDEHGVYPASLVAADGLVYLYYIGWNTGARPPLFYASIGLAISEDRGETFGKHSAAPILSRSDHDPCLVTSPCVLVDGGVWRMWYVSGFRWEEVDGALRSYYDVKYAESDDGLNWRREGLVCIDLAAGERNIARPCVIKEKGDRYRMWYSTNAGGGYRIGYAESRDGYAWTRMDAEAGIERSASGWDSKAQAYAWVVSRGDREFMLYNGNDFGREGFGLARREPRREPQSS